MALGENIKKLREENILRSSSLPIGCTFPGRPSADGRVERGVRI